MKKQKLKAVKYLLQYLDPIDQNALLWISKSKNSFFPERYDT